MKNKYFLKQYLNSVIKYKGAGHIYKYRKNFLKLLYTGVCSIHILHNTSQWYVGIFLQDEKTSNFNAGFNLVKSISPNVPARNKFVSEFLIEFFENFSPKFPFTRIFFV